MKDRSKRYTALTVVFLVIGLIAGFAAVDKAAAQAVRCNRTITADVVALDQNYFLNRLGSLNNLGMIYALERDVHLNTFDAQGNFTRFFHGKTAGMAEYWNDGMLGLLYP